MEKADIAAGNNMASYNANGRVYVPVMSKSRAAIKMAKAPPKEWNMKDMPEMVPIAFVP